MLCTRFTDAYANTVHPRLSGLDYPAPRLTGRVSLLLKGEKALSNKPPSFRFSAIVLMKVKLFNNLFC